MNRFLISFIGTVFPHAHMYRPAAEGTAGNSGNDIARNYDINNPVGAARYHNPCGHPAKGVPVEKFTAGQNIPVEIGGSALHGGGHCQFGFSYDRKNFAVTHTVTGTCPLEKNYNVPIPKDAPKGVVTFIWGWNNKIGMREMYISCAEIEIVGGQDSGSIDGKELLVSNIQGAPNPEMFPAEDFSKELGDTKFNEQKPISVSPSGTHSRKKTPGSNENNQKDSIQKKQEERYEPETDDKKFKHSYDPNTEYKQQEQQYSPNIKSQKQELNYAPMTGYTQQLYVNENRYYEPKQNKSRFGTDVEFDQDIDFSPEGNTNNDNSVYRNKNTDINSGRKGYNNHYISERIQSDDSKVDDETPGNQVQDDFYKNQPKPDYTQDSQEIADQNQPPKEEDQSSGNRGQDRLEQVKEKVKAQCEKSGCTGWNLMYNPLRKDYDYYTY